MQYVLSPFSPYISLISLHFHWLLNLFLDVFFNKKRPRQSPPPPHSSTPQTVYGWKLVTLQLRAVSSLRTSLRTTSFDLWYLTKVLRPPIVEFVIVAPDLDSGRLAGIQASPSYVLWVPQGLRKENGLQPSAFYTTHYLPSDANSVSYISIYACFGSASTERTLHLSFR